MARVRRLQWFGHVQRREEGGAISVVRSWQVEGRPCGRPKKSWIKTVQEDMRMMGISENLASDR